MLKNGTTISLQTVGEECSQENGIRFMSFERKNSKVYHMLSEELIVTPVNLHDRLKYHLRHVIVSNPVYGKYLCFRSQVIVVTWARVVCLIAAEG